VQREHGKIYSIGGGNYNVLLFQFHKNYYLYTDNTNKNDADRRHASEILKKQVR
jgi:hypothetical protein